MKLYKKIGVVGLGYVGLPLAVAFSKKYDVVGFDINSQRISELKKGVDLTLEVNSKELNNSKKLSFTSDASLLKECDFLVVTVPTPVTADKIPDLNPLINASKTIGQILQAGTTVIYESTVFPGATEEICAPILEQESNLKLNVDFYIGYSPERINPGDKDHRISDIVKVTSGSTPEIAEEIDQLYSSIILAGTYKASSIKVAEAAKVIENTQRDINIALINELSIIFNNLNIDTQEVLKAASTKWNFLSFLPGLVGGHCIGVDPYYLTYKSEQVGYSPKVILAGRKLNDDMGLFIASELIEAMKHKKINIKNAKILVMGLTFKENCPDTRNTKVIDIINDLSKEVSEVECFDPWVDVDDVKMNYQINQINFPKDNEYDAVILSVAHEKIIELGIDKIREFGKPNHVLYDLKYLFSKNESDIRL
jgi:UDP-N-acetyl-D-glucosamine/UDP-N-acetyl-D-galactosamine dehydrogenase